ncbi:MAG: DNA polymerase III subunit delta' [Alphaproteobacteria bacterium]|nr:DNA polymerase III subunit delta' [Alphaproteobacteria bacterium]TAD87745.1 MAG: DNA polymerase III subunit delta' [Alphaproteobacteria bacterium]
MASAPDQPHHPRLTLSLIGQDAAEQRFLEAWTSGRLHHAWMLAGPRGIGKATLAYRIARFVLASSAAGEVDMFGAPVAPTSLALPASHPVVARIASGGHKDLIAIERAWDAKRGKARSEIAVDQIRAIADLLHLTPGEGGWRVVIVDPADDLNTNAANALLKMLEEPPRQTLLMLVTHAPGALLPTIRSRCRRLDVAALSEGEVRRLLGNLRPDLAEPEADALAVLGDGSIGRAMDLAEQGGVELYRSVVTTLASGPDPEAVMALGDRCSRADGSLDVVIDLMRWWLARLARAAARGSLPAPAIEGEERAARAVLARLPPDRLADAWTAIGTIFARADGLNLDRRQTVLDAFAALR